MFDRGCAEYWEPPDTPAARALTTTLVGIAREENQAAARRLATVAELFEMRRAERGEEPDWAVDTWAAVGAEVAAALGISLGRAASYLNYGLAMLRLPAVAAMFAAGQIDMDTYRTVVYRTGLINDDDAMADVDQLLAARLGSRPILSRGRLITEIDRVITRRDPDAVRRTTDRVRDRDVTIWDAEDGTSDLSGRLLATDAHVLDKRLDTLAATVCPADPRTLPQRRADALGALAAGADRLMCRCGGDECPAAAPTASAVVVHVVAEQASLDGDTDRPGYLLGAGAVISAELLREIAAQARVRPLSAPTEADPGYRPSKALADFVRARDVTCRAPGCDRPATECDIDHTVPYPHGVTHASNMKSLCRIHHILKTFWGWRDWQLEDGTVFWELPDGTVYRTEPGSVRLQPNLCGPPASSGDRAARMPRRRRSRKHDRAQRIANERRHNRERRESAERLRRQAVDDGEPPPF